MKIYILRKWVTDTDGECYWVNQACVSDEKVANEWEDADVFNRSYSEFELDENHKN